MFDRLSDKLEAVFKKLKGRGKLNEAQVGEAPARGAPGAPRSGRELSRSSRSFVEKVRGRAVGTEVLQSLAPGQQVDQDRPRRAGAAHGRRGGQLRLDLAAKPPVAIMLVGLQGAGKTTSCGKLARHLKGQRKKPLLGPGRRLPSGRHRAAEGARAPARHRGVRHPPRPTRSRSSHLPAPPALRDAERQGSTSVIYDTAGRHQIDDYLMEELEGIRDELGAARDPVRGRRHDRAGSGERSRPASTTASASPA